MERIRTARHVTTPHSGTTMSITRFMLRLPARHQAIMENMLATPRSLAAHSRKGLHSKVKR